MNIEIFSLSLIPIVGVNIWHGFLLIKHRGGDKLHTISEYAASSPKLLVAHRLMHTLSGAAMVVLAYSYLLPNGYSVMAVILIVGGAFDAIEAFVLNKGNTKRIVSFNSHQVTAWIMATCYLIYGIFITYYAGLNQWVSNGVWLLFMILLGYSIIKKFKNFWITQMTYFVILGGVILAAHLALLA